MTTSGLSRRQALTGAATAGIGLPLLAACGGESEEPATGSGDRTSSGSEPSDSASAPAPAEGSAALASTADIPEGGGAVFADQKVVVTQPTAGDFRCFTAVCTHQGCLVSSVEEGSINCTCHGSRFSIEDGSPQSGPATAPLGEVPVKVAGGEITLA